MAVGALWPVPGPGGGRYLRRLVAVPDPELGFSPAARVGAGQMLFRPGAEFGPRRQTAYELILLVRGELTIEVAGAAGTITTAGPPLDVGGDGATGAIDEGQHTVSPVLRGGDIVLLVPGLECTFRFSRRVETLVNYVMTYDPALPLPVLDLLPGHPVALPSSDAIRRLVETILAASEQAAWAGPETSTTSAAAPIWLGTSTIALFVDEARAAGLIRGRAAAREHPAITAARDLVRQRLGERIGLQAMSEAAHVAPEHLVRLFRRRLGTTPVRYLWSARVRMGVHLLENTDLSVAEIARRVGCLSPKHFTRLVRADFGMPPRDIRRRSAGSAAPLVAAGSGDTSDTGDSGDSSTIGASGEATPA
ncbi:MAG: hypothetical protein AVDCRST_MAG77-1351 [uncultured Chloroflexi bacterium]|uniref:HTH araC/xylS-type domain-containing protein n=1 Tax=uncultured Chloroflexota bacterium TaxID=166587 RepID=A0A6J4I1L9_9CHLR|nr:MAG: hypothetical protein AVDCRST_MAG77-1351 [uncultured Chloroflexota bacterium]